MRQRNVNLKEEVLLQYPSRIYRFLHTLNNKEVNDFKLVLFMLREAGEAVGVMRRKAVINLVKFFFSFRDNNKSHQCFLSMKKTIINLVKCFFSFRENIIHLMSVSVH